MRKILAAVVAVAVAAPAIAQEVRVSPPPVDTTVFMSRAEAQATIADLTGQIAKVQGNVPPACGAVPAPDTVGGSIGVGAACTPRADAARPARGQWTRGVTDASCQITWSWGTAYTVPVISVTTQDAGMPVLWSIVSISSTSATLRATRLRTLPASIAVVTALASFDVTLGSCSGITAHLGVREQLIAQ